MASMVESLVNEFREEVPATRKLLERVPNDKLSWKPHPKSRSLGELAMHVANIPRIAEAIATSDEFSPGTLPPVPIESADQIRSAFDANVKAADGALSKLNDQTVMKEWRFVYKGKQLFAKPKIAGLRTNVLNHTYHHRGQLGVYLRLLDVPVPVVYGPTADENPFG
jgi:uncharacterized damage-inducible protein DinB